MASGLPSIQPPRTPSPAPPTLVEPPVDDDRDDTASAKRNSGNWNDIDSLLSTSASSRRSAFLHPDSQSFLRPPSMSFDDVPTDGGAAPAPAAASPFNFQTQYITTSPVKSNIGQRRGHRYKHSSISAQHQIFQEPPPRPPPVLPASLPVPTIKEAWSSMQKDQRARMYWCLCHGLVATYIFFSASGSLAMTALSHLVFFDVGSAAICVAVDLLGNFEVWKRSSIRHPFGLQRAEVLAGFAMSVFLVFGGFDLLSHNLKHILESVGSHTPHHPHDHPGHGGPGRTISPGTVDMASLAAVLSTLVSAYGLKNHTRIRRVMRVAYPAYLSSLLPDILANPFHFLTLCFSFLMLLLPLLSVAYFVWLDRLICAAIAVSMFVLGVRLAVAQGLMLLMSYSGRRGSGITSTSTLEDDKNGTSVASVVREIESEPAVSRVDEAQFWQVHYGLCMANLRVCVVRGCDDGTLSQLRTRVGRVIQNRLGEGYGKGGALRWEVTMQMSTDPN